MHRAYRHWLTPCVLLVAMALTMASAAGLVWLSDRYDSLALRLQPIGSDRVLIPRSQSVVLFAGGVALVGGLLLMVAVRPVRAHLLVRNAAMQTAMASIGPLALLRDAIGPRLLIVAVLAVSAFLPAVGLCGVAWLRLPRYRSIPRRQP